MKRLDYTELAESQLSFMKSSFLKDGSMSTVLKTPKKNNVILSSRTSNLSIR